MEALIAELKRAIEGSRELDNDIFLATHPEQGTKSNGVQYWCAANTDEEGGPWVILPFYTTSLDAAMAIIPDRPGGSKAGFLQFAMYQTCIGDISDERVALVVCIAALKACQAMKDDA